MSTLWPIEKGRDCIVPSLGRRVVIPLVGQRPALGEPAYFDPIDPQDVDIVQYDFSVVSFSGDSIVSALVTSSPPVLMIGQTILFGLLVQAFVGPMSGAAKTLELRCGVTFASGRAIDWVTDVSVLSL